MRKGRFSTLKDIENLLVYLPPLFIVIAAVIAIVITTFFLDHKRSSQFELMKQEDRFTKKEIIKSYIDDINRNSHSVFDDVEKDLIQSIYEFRGFIRSQDYGDIEVELLVDFIKEFELQKGVGFVLFDTLDYELYHGNDIVKHLQTLTNANVQTKDFRKHILRNISTIGKENLQYWIDNKKRKIRLSYFENIDNTTFYVGVFSKVDDIKYLTRDKILEEMRSKSLGINGHFWFFDYLNSFTYNYKNKGKTIFDKEFIQDINNNLKKEGLVYYNFPKYQFLVSVNQSYYFEEKIKQLDELYSKKRLTAYLIILFIAIFLIFLVIIFAKFITKIFAKYNRRLFLRNRLFKEWKDRYELAIIASNDGFWDIDFNTDRIYFSKQWLEMFDYEKDDIKSLKEWYSLIHDDEREEIYTLIENCLEGEESNFICEYRIRTKDDRYVWVLSRAKVTKNSEGLNQRMTMMTTNIDDRKNLIQERNYLDLLVDVGRIVIFKLQNNNSLRVDYVSASLSSYGYSDTEIKNYIDLVYDDDKEMLLQTIKNTLDNKENSFSLTHRILEKSGDIKWVFSRVILLKDHFGRVTHFYGYLNDITSLKLNEQELEHRVNVEVRKNLQKDRILAHQSKLASMGEMIGNIAHQWRQPLNNINLLIHYLRDNYKNMEEEEVSSVIAQSKTQIDFMSNTIDDFRNFYQPNKDKSEFDLKKSILEAYTVVKTHFEKTDIKFSIKGDNVTIFNFENEFQQVLVNILNNANDAAKLKKKTVDFTPEVKIDINKFKSTVVISIRNNCGKASKEVLERMFEAYFTTKFENLGTGIGLYMSKTIIERNMDGSISVDNEDDGVRFTVILSL